MKMILVPPTIHTEMPDTRITVAEGATSRLVCNASGNPEPKISWSKEGASLGPLASQPDGSLVLGAVASQDSGVYTCLAENGIPPGATLDFHVFVQCKLISLSFILQLFISFLLILFLISFFAISNGRLCNIPSHIFLASDS